MREITSSSSRPAGDRARPGLPAFLWSLAVAVAEIIWAFDGAMASEIARQVRLWRGAAAAPIDLPPNPRQDALSTSLPMGERRRFPRPTTPT